MAGEQGPVYQPLQDFLDLSLAQQEAKRIKFTNEAIDHLSTEYEGHFWCRSPALMSEVMLVLALPEKPSTLQLGVLNEPRVRVETILSSQLQGCHGCRMAYIDFKRDLGADCDDRRIPPRVIQALARKLTSLDRERLADAFNRGKELDSPCPELIDAVQEYFSDISLSVDEFVSDVAVDTILDRSQRDVPLLFDMETHLPGPFLMCLHTNREARQWANRLCRDIGGIEPDNLDVLLPVLDIFRYMLSVNILHDGGTDEKLSIPGSAFISTQREVFWEAVASFFSLCQPSCGSRLVNEVPSLIKEILRADAAEHTRTRELQLEILRNIFTTMGTQIWTSDIGELSTLINARLVSMIDMDTTQGRIPALLLEIEVMSLFLKSLQTSSVDMMSLDVDDTGMDQWSCEFLQVLLDVYADETVPEEAKMKAVGQVFTLLSDAYSGTGPLSSFIGIQWTWVSVLLKYAAPKLTAGAEPDETELTIQARNLVRQILISDTRVIVQAIQDADSEVAKHASFETLVAEYNMFEDDFMHVHRQSAISCRVWRYLLDTQCTSPAQIHASIASPLFLAAFCTTLTLTPEERVEYGEESVQHPLVGGDVRHLSDDLLKDLYSGLMTFFRHASVSPQVGKWFDHSEVAIYCLPFVALGGVNVKKFLSLWRPDAKTYQAQLSLLAKSQRRAVNTGLRLSLLLYRSRDAKMDPKFTQFLCDLRDIHSDLFDTVFHHDPLPVRELWDTLRDFVINADRTADNALYVATLDLLSVYLRVMRSILVNSLDKQHPQCKPEWMLELLYTWKEQSAEVKTCLAKFLCGLLDQVTRNKWHSLVPSIRDKLEGWADDIPSDTSDEDLGNLRSAVRHLASKTDGHRGPPSMQPASPMLAISGSPNSIGGTTESQELGEQMLAYASQDSQDIDERLDISRPRSPKKYSSLFLGIRAPDLSRSRRQSTDTEKADDGDDSSSAASQFRPGSDPDSPMITGAQTVIVNDTPIDDKPRPPSPAGKPLPPRKETGKVVAASVPSATQPPPRPRDTLDIRKDMKEAQVSEEKKKVVREAPRSVPPPPKSVASLLGVTPSKPPRPKQQPVKDLTVDDDDKWEPPYAANVAKPVSKPPAPSARPRTSLTNQQPRDFWSPSSTRNNVIDLTLDSDDDDEQESQPLSSRTSTVSVVPQKKMASARDAAAAMKDLPLSQVQETFRTLRAYGMREGILATPADQTSAVDTQEKPRAASAPAREESTVKVVSYPGSSTAAASTSKPATSTKPVIPESKRLKKPSTSRSMLGQSSIRKYGKDRTSFGGSADTGPRDPKTALSSLSSMAASSRKKTQKPRLGIIQSTTLSASNASTRAPAREPVDIQAALLKFRTRVLDWNFNELLDHADRIEGDLVKKVPLKFETVDEYEATFKPLLFMELQAALVSDYKKEKAGDNDIRLKFLSDKKLGQSRYHIDFEIVKVPTKMRDLPRGEDLGVIELVPSNSDKARPTPTKKCLGRVLRSVREGLRRMTLEVRLKNSPSLKIGSEWTFTKAGFLIHSQRQYLALKSLHASPHLNTVLSKPAPVHNQNRHGMKITLDDISKPRLDEVIGQYNREQAQAIQSSISSSGITLLQGPPGTGKTKTILGMVSLMLSCRPTEASSRGSSRQRVAPFSPVLRGSAGTATTSSKMAGIRKASQSVVRALGGGSSRASSIPASPFSRSGETDSQSSSRQVRILLLAPSNGAVDELASRVMARELIGVKNPVIVRTGPLTRVTRDQVKQIHVDVLAEKAYGELSANSSEMVKLQQALDGKIRDRQQLEERIRNDQQQNESFLQAGGDVGTYHAEGQKIQALKRRSQTARIEINNLRQKRSGQAVVRSSEKQKTRMRIFNEAEIVCSTLNSADSVDFTRAGSAGFDYIIVDEAGQAVELSTLIPLNMACQHVILVGDPAQLPATVISTRAAQNKYERSLFDRLQKNGYPVTVLTRQYRMDPDICAFPSKEFYNSELKTDESVRLRRRPQYTVISQTNYTFVNLSSQQQGNSPTYNKAEAKFIHKVCRHLMETYGNDVPDLEKRISVVTPYQDQRREIVYALKGSGGKVPAIRVSTIDGFQGQENDIVLFSCVRSNTNTVGFLSDVRRLNVALTRAKYSMILVGDASTLKMNPVWEELIRDASERGCYVNAEDYRFPHKGSTTIRRRPSASIMSAVPVPKSRTSTTTTTTTATTTTRTAATTSAAAVKRSSTTASSAGSQRPRAVTPGAVPKKRKSGEFDTGSRGGKKSSVVHVGPATGRLVVSSDGRVINPVNGAAIANAVPLKRGRFGNNNRAPPPRAPNEAAPDTQRIALGYKALKKRERAEAEKQDAKRRKNSVQPFLLNGEDRFQAVAPRDRIRTGGKKPSNSGHSSAIQRAPATSNNAARSDKDKGKGKKPAAKPFSLESELFDMDK